MSFFGRDGWLDRKLLKYDWYKKWQAKRSRRNLERKDPLKIAKDDEVETYDASGLAARENERYQKVLAARRAQEEEYLREDIERANKQLAEDTQRKLDAAQDAKPGTV